MRSETNFKTIMTGELVWIKRNKLSHVSDNC